MASILALARVWVVQGTTTHMIGCGPHPAVTITFFLSYIMLSSFILINIFVAIIVDSVAAHYKVILAARVSFPRE